MTSNGVQLSEIDSGAPHVATTLQRKVMRDMKKYLTPQKSMKIGAHKFVHWAKFNVAFWLNNEHLPNLC
jgi:hypothetical protein